jgi:hypothetical protein
LPSAPATPCLAKSSFAWYSIKSTTYPFLLVCVFVQDFLSAP